VTVNGFIEQLVGVLEIYVPRLIACLVVFLLAWVLVRIIESLLYRFARVVEKAYIARLMEVVKVAVYGSALLIAISILLPEALALPVVIALIGFALILSFTDILRSLGAELFVRTMGIVRRGDWIEVDGVLVRVVDMDVLGVTGETPRMERVFIPYSKLVSSAVINRSTPLGLSVRVRVEIPSKYGVEAARRVLEDAARAVAEDLVTEPHISLTSIKSDTLAFSIEMHLLNARKLGAVLEELSRRIKQAVPEAVVEA